tara:strand:+ start:985 stop:1197 length:213 start_codon:yes stop_codon:yes gene_type:complete
MIKEISKKRKINGSNMKDISSEIADIFNNKFKTQDDIISVKVEYVMVDGKKVYDLDGMRKQLEIKMGSLK